jgi:hypothetical protein
VDGGTILTAVTQPVRPPSLLVAGSVRFERRVNAHQGQNRGLPAIPAAKPPRCPRRRLVPLSGAPGCWRDAVAGRSRCAHDGVARVRRRRRARRHRRRPLRQSGQPGNAGSAPRAAGIALVAGVETVPTQSDGPCSRVVAVLYTKSPTTLSQNEPRPAADSPRLALVDRARGRWPRRATSASCERRRSKPRSRRG